MLGALLVKGAFRTIKRRTDPDTRGGAPLLGLNGIVFKAHGSARERAIMNGIGQAVQAVEHHINDIIRSEAARANQRVAAAGPRGSPIKSRTGTPHGGSGQTMKSSPKKFNNPRARHNFQGRTCSILAVGSYVPEHVLANAQFEKLVNTSDEWITTRTGIKERRIAAKNEFTSDLAAKAALCAIARANITPDQIDLIVVATITPDMPFPSTACLVQEKIGARRAVAFDIQAACSGFIFGLEVGQQFIMSRTYDTALVIGAEKLSSIVNWSDRNTCVLFGDGAGAAILRHRPAAHGLLTACMGSDGSRADLLCMPGGGSSCPASARIPGRRECISCT